MDVRVFIPHTHTHMCACMGVRGARVRIPHTHRFTHTYMCVRMGVCVFIPRTHTDSHIHKREGHDYSHLYTTHVSLNLCVYVCICYKWYGYGCSHDFFLCNCSKLQHTAMHTTRHGNTRQHTAIPCSILQCTATRRNTLQHTATHCNTLQHNSTHCNTMQHIGFSSGCIFAYLCIYLCVYPIVCACVCMCTCTHLNACTYMCISVHFYTLVYIVYVSVRIPNPVYMWI